MKNRITEYPEQAALKTLYRMGRGVRRRGKTGKHGQVEVKRKWWVSVQPPYSPQGELIVTVKK